MPTQILIYFLRHDLRLSDNPVFYEIQRAFDSESPRFTHLLPIYVFPSHQIEVSGFIPAGNDPASTPKSPYPEARSKVAGFWRCGPHRAKFLAESVWDLKNTLEQKDSRLVIRVGQATDVLRDILRHVQEAESPAGKTSTSSAGRQVVGIWMTKDGGVEERQEEEAIQELAESSGLEFRSFQDEKYYVHEYDSPPSEHSVIVFQHYVVQFYVHHHVLSCLGVDCYLLLYIGVPISLTCSNSCTF
jgi:deoxyribodipyrimidine photo-lyase